MNSLQILYAITDIDSRYILSAQEVMGLMTSPARRKAISRKLVLIVATLAFIAATFTTALAVSPEFRDSVFAFWGISQTEIIPELNPFEEQGATEMDVKRDKIDIGGIIEATYVQCPMHSYAQNSIFKVCTDEVMMNSGNHYDAYYVEEQSFIQLEEQHFSETYQILGRDIHMEFDWVEYNGIVSFTYVDPDVSFRKANLSGPAEATLFTVDIDLPGDLGCIGYPVLINVRTGELNDICAGTGVEHLPEISQAAISEDLSKLLLVDRDGLIYYLDLLSRQLYSLDALSGEHVAECSLIGNTIACWTLEDASIEEAKLGTYRAWTIDLTTFARTELFSGIPATAATSYDVWSETYGLYEDVPDIWANVSNGKELEPLGCEGLHFIEGFDKTLHWGNMYAGSHFAVEVNSDRTVSVIDLATGEKALIDGFLWPDAAYPNIEYCPSPDGRKLLFHTRTTDGYFATIGVLDFDQKLYFEFDRQNLGLTWEHTVYWLDNDTIVVDTKDNGTSKDFYLYRLL